MTTAVATGIALELDCRDDLCREFARPLFDQMASGAYDECSVMPIPESLDEWAGAHRTARKRARHAERLGYTFAQIKRKRYEDDVHAINTSLEHRQGRPMSAGYLERPTFPDDEHPCDLHGVHANGVFDPDLRLVAYLWMYRAGDLALVSQILGHGDHLRNDVMFLLFRGALEREIAVGPGEVVYNRADSGTDGLRAFKTRLGFRAEHVEWRP